MSHTQPDKRDYWETSSEEEDEATPDAAKAIQDKQEASNSSTVDGNTSKARGDAADGSGGDQKADDAEPPKPALPEYSTRPSSAAAAKPSTSSGDVAAPAHDGGSGSPPASVARAPTAARWRRPWPQVYRRGAGGGGVLPRALPHLHLLVVPLVPLRALPSLEPFISGFSVFFGSDLKGSSVV